MADECCCVGVNTLIFSCSGGSDVGELSDRVARKMAKCGPAKIFCLAGVGAHITGMIESTRAANKIITIDGCAVSCSKKTLEHANFNVMAFNLQDMGFEKGKTKVNDESIDQVLSKITGGTVDEGNARITNNCCGS